MYLFLLWYFIHWTIRSLIIKSCIIFFLSNIVIRRIILNLSVFNWTTSSIRRFYLNRTNIAVGRIILNLIYFRRRITFVQKTFLNIDPLDKSIIYIRRTIFNLNHLSNNTTFFIIKIIFDLSCLSIIITFIRRIILN